MVAAKKIRVGVIFGGKSGEHEVSLLSAQAVLENLDPQKFEAIPFAITKQGRLLNPQKSTLYLAHSQKGELPASPPPAPVEPLPSSTVEKWDRDGSTAISPQLFQATEVFFPVLHGTYGEDGKIQGWFEMMDVPYVGCGVLSSACAMDKGIMKQLFIANKIPTPDFCQLFKHDWEADPAAIMRAVRERFALPLFVKPANLGSSIGISKVKEGKDLEPALASAFEYDRKVLVEKGINAREIEISVLGYKTVKTSVIGEIFPGHEFYDYQAKYQGTGTRLEIPAQLSEAQRIRVKELATSAFRALDCSGLARADFFVDRETGEIYLNELNTMPGFTVHSMYPKLWEAAGLPFPKLINELIELAFERHRDYRGLKTTFEGSI